MKLYLWYTTCHDTDESIMFLKKVIKPYVKKQIQLLKHSTDQKALVIMNVLTGQMMAAVHEDFKEAGIFIGNIPANVKKFYQPLDLTVNACSKQFLKHKFDKWYSGKVRA